MVHLQYIVSGFLQVVLLATAAVFASMVLTRYGAEGADVRPPINWRHPARSAERLAVWLGIVILGFSLKVVATSFGKFYATLSEASADVGEWFLRQRHQNQ